MLEIQIKVYLYNWLMGLVFLFWADVSLLRFLQFIVTTDSLITHLFLNKSFYNEHLCWKS